MNKSNARALKRILASKDVRASLKTFLAQQTRKTFKPMKKARIQQEKQKRLTKKETWEAIKAAVLARSGGRCEAMYSVGSRCCSGAVDVDHWENGNGRRVEKQSVSNCWHLCRIHHDLRQGYVMGVAYWNANLARHCTKYGYPFVPHIEHAPLKSSTPSVPEAGSPLPSAKGIGGVDLKQEQLSEKEG